MKLAINVIKFLASEKDRDEIRKMSLGTGNVVLSSAFPSITTCYSQIMRDIEQKKSKKVLFKTLARALIPDFDLWANNNGEYMRTEYQIKYRLSEVFKIRI